MNILVRTNSSTQIGLGHVMRCLLLAQRMKSYQPNIHISFACELLEGNINHQITEAGFSFYELKSNDVSELLDLATKLTISLLIIDSYDFFLEDEEQCLNKGFKTLVFDDLYKPHLADIVLNHGIQASIEDYHDLIKQGKKLLCGSQYTLLRDEFFDCETTEKKNHIAIIMGGNDVLNLSPKIVSCLWEINKEFNLTILTASSNKYIKELKKLKEIELYIDSENIAGILAKQEYIICASGGTLFEVMALRKKFINIQVADNQQSIVDFLQRKKIYSTLQPNDICIDSLNKKIEYLKEHDIYENLMLHFNRFKLPEMILDVASES